MRKIMVIMIYQNEGQLFIFLSTSFQYNTSFNYCSIFGKERDSTEKMNMLNSSPLVTVGFQKVKDSVFISSFQRIMKNINELLL